MVLVVNQKTKFLENPLSNILAFATGSGNTGYFGIPVGIALFGEKVLPVFIIAGFGFILFENSLGFFLYSSWDPLEIGKLLETCESALHL